MGIKRKREIYDICVEYGQSSVHRYAAVSHVSVADIIIVEDDPYYFLQEGKYIPKSERVSESSTDDEQFIASLVPSYLK